MAYSKKWLLFAHMSPVFYKSLEYYQLGRLVWTSGAQGSS